MRLLTKSDFGLYNNYVSWLSIITIIVTLNLSSTLISARFDFERSFDEYILSMITLSSIVTGIAIIIVNIFMDSLSIFLGLEPFYINLMLIYLLFWPAVDLFQA